MSHPDYLPVLLLGSVLACTGIESAEPADEDEKIIVTGSLIKKADQNGPSPILSISSEDMIQLGHTNLYEVLSSLTAQTGSLAEGDQFPNGFTSAAQALNLRGFGPGRTLVLVNGQRLALNPIPYQSEANFFNFAIIPTIAIERIDVLTDGASAIYGSDAIAGVINVILRDEFDSNQITFTYGATKEGGGESRKITGGTSFRAENDINFTIGYQWEQREPFFGTDRKFFESLDLKDEQLYTASIGEGPVIPQGRDDEQVPVYVLPDGEPCARHPGLVERRFDLTLIPDTITQWDVCSRNRFDESLRNRRDTQSIYFRSSWDTDFGSAFSNLMYWQSDNTSRPDRLSWSGFYAGNNGNDEWDNRTVFSLRREFNPVETGTQDNRIDENSISLNVGFEGITENTDYSVQFTHSKNSTEQKRLWLKGVETVKLFIDPVGFISGGRGQDLCDDDRDSLCEDGRGVEIPEDAAPPFIPIIGRPQASVFDFFQPSELADITGFGVTNAISESTNLSYWVSGEFFSANDTPIEFAFVAEWNRTQYDLRVDETTANFGWSGVGGSSGNGARERLALGTEWLFTLVNDHSVFGNVDLTLAARWDDYHDTSEVGDANTWKAALQWDITDSFTLRTTESTSFRAPDLHYLNAGNTRYFITVIDVLECIENPLEDGSMPSYEDCRNNPTFKEDVTVNWKGSKEIKEETGKTQTLGFVYQPNIDLVLTLDLYDIKLFNQVGLQLESQIMLWDAQCSRGELLESGDSLDPDSEVCEKFGSLVNRFTFARSFIRDIENIPMNRAFRQQRGVDLRYSQFFEYAENGKFGVDFQYSHIFETKTQEIADEPSTYNGSFRDDPANGEIRTRSNLTLSWANEQWSSALSIFRKGSSPKKDGIGRLKSWKTANLVISKSLEDNDDLRLIIRNLTNEIPPIDDSIGSWPFFDRTQYNAVGTEWFVEYQRLF